MWLINVESRRLQEFIGIRAPKYAILSHTWVNGQEVTFQEMMGAAGQRSAESAKTGWDKINMTCLQAARDGLEYAWVDTCCIDKTSSAELSEAINSMFQWYGRAVVCYVFLPDLTLSSSALESSENLRANIEHCRWFTRSWTLQELIAPLYHNFFNRDWELCFTKASASAALAQITRIDTGILEHSKDLSAVSVAQKMSWAATRESTRIEDAAYSLMGIFEINMPLLYGEEDRAFLRLQTEIINSCPDPTILAWTLPEDNSTERLEKPITQYSGVMASSPIFFRDGADVEALSDQAIVDFSMSNRGIKLRAQFGLFRIRRGGGSHIILPVCRRQGKVYGIQLRNVGRGSFARQNPTTLIHERMWDVRHRLTLDPFLLKQLPTRPFTATQTQTETPNLVMEARKCVMQLVLPHGMEVYRRWPWQHWDERDMLFFGSEASAENLGWAAVKIVTGPPSSFLDVNSETHGSVDFMFYAFGWATSAAEPERTARAPRCTMHRVRGSTEDRGLEQMNQEAMNDSWNAYWVASRLVRHGVGEQDMMVAGEDATDVLLLHYKMSSVEDETISSKPFWRVEFGWSIVPKDQVPRIRNRGWRGVDWGGAFFPPWEALDDLDDIFDVDDEVCSTVDEY